MAKNYEKMTDEELEKIIVQKSAQKKFEDMSNDELDSFILTKMSEQAPKERKRAEAAIEGFGQAATFGYLPQLQAGAETVVEKLTPESDADKVLRDLGISEEKPGYTEKRDQYSKRGEELKQAEPGYTMGGQVAGAIVSGVALGGVGTGAKVATAAQRMKTAIKTGAAIGLIRNPGDIEGEISPVQLQDRLKNAAFDSVTAIAFQGGGEILGKMAGKLKEIPGKLQEWGELKALKASGGMLKDFRREFGKGRARTLGRAMLDKGIVAAGDDIGMVAKKSTMAKEAAGQEIGAILKEADASAEAMTSIANVEKNLAPSARKLLKRSEANLTSFSVATKERIEQELKGIPGVNSVKNAVFKELDEMAVNGKNVPLEQLKRVRTAVDDLINFSKSNQQLSGVEKHFFMIRTVLQGMAKNRLKILDKLDKGDRLIRFKKANSDYSQMKTVSDMARDKLARETSNSTIGLRERIQSGVGGVVGGMMGQSIAGPGGAVVGAVVGSTVGAISTKVARKYGTPVVAKMAVRTADKLRENPNLLGKFADPLIKALQSSPKEFVTTIEALKSDPEFRKKINTDLKKEDGKFRQQLKNAR